MILVVTGSAFNSEEVCIHLLCMITVLSRKFLQFSKLLSRCQNSIFVFVSICQHHLAFVSSYIASKLLLFRNHVIQHISRQEQSQKTCDRPLESSDYTEHNYIYEYIYKNRTMDCELKSQAFTFCQKLWGTHQAFIFGFSSPELRSHLQPRYQNGRF